MDSVIEALDSWNDFADQLLIGGDNLLDNIEYLKNMDEVE